MNIDTKFNTAFRYVIMYVTYDSKDYYGFGDVKPFSLSDITGHALICAGRFVTPRLPANDGTGLNSSVSFVTGTLQAYLAQQFEIHSILYCGNHVLSQLQSLPQGTLLSTFSEHRCHNLTLSFFSTLEKISLGEVPSSLGNTVGFDIIKYQTYYDFRRSCSHVLSIYNKSGLPFALPSQKPIVEVAYLRYSESHPPIHTRRDLPVGMHEDAGSVAAIPQMINLLSDRGCFLIPF